MKVNWQNLGAAIRSGQAANENSGMGSPVESGNLGFYDNPMSDFSEHAAERSRNNPKVFVYGFSKWGQEDRVKE